MIEGLFRAAGHFSTMRIFAALNENGDSSLLSNFNKVTP
jgi:hypothetical protein